MSRRKSMATLLSNGRRNWKGRRGRISLYQGAGGGARPVESIQERGVRRRKEQDERRTKETQRRKRNDQ